jgi:hypothetical protein
MALLAVVLASALAWLVGTQVAFRWDDVKRRRELDLAALNDFYKCYGAFVRTWRIWNTHKRHSCHAKSDEIKWNCLEQASSIESDLERLLVKIVSERKLEDRDRLLLGCVREAFQCLRENIREDRALRWYSRSPSSGKEFREYQAFKALAAYMGVLLQTTHTRWLVGSKRRDLPSEDESRESLHMVTTGDRLSDWLAIVERECIATAKPPVS